MSLQIVLLLIALLVLSFTGTYVIKRLAHRFQIVDVPNHRSSHQGMTPRGGGLAIVISWYAGISFLYLNGELDAPIYFAFMSGMLLAITSLIDDIVSLPPQIRLAMQVLSSIVALYFLQGMEPISLYFFSLNSQFLILPIVVVGMVWFINLYNFLDGIDGYASVEAIFMGVALFIFTQNIVLLLLVVAVLGFLAWNWPKAKIFMGDVGSTQLGFILVVLAIYFHNTGSLNIGLWIVLTAPYWFDATFTLFRRWRNNEKLSEAHKKHAYQRIVQAGFSHKQTLVWLIVINLVILLLAWLSYTFFAFHLLVGVLVIAMLYALTIRIDKLKSFN